MYNLLVIAPGHNEMDHRVNRTIDVFSKKFDNIYILYESRYSLKKDTCFVQEKIKTIYIDDTSPRLKAIPRFKPFLVAVQKIGIKNIYIHDSGILGLLIARKLKERYKEKITLIFDYHDFIPWEIYYQSKKLIHNTLVRRFFNKILISFLYCYFQKKFFLDGLIGISNTQIKSLLNIFPNCNEIKYLSLPNTRKKLDFILIKNTYDDEALNLLWIGNIVNGRDLPETITFLDHLNIFYNFKFYIFGKIISQELFNALEERSYLFYMGEFSSDLEILNFAKSRKIASLFFGWNDPDKVGINEISSPNKVYSYINTGIPVLLNKKVNYENFKTKNKIGELFTDFDSFKLGYEKIMNNYHFYKESIYKSKDEYIWDSNIIDLFSNFVDEVYFEKKHV